MKVAQATHHQGDIRYRTSRGIQCSCMSLLPFCRTLFKSASIWDSFDLDCILQKGNLLFKSLNNYRYFGLEDLLQELFNRTGKITAGIYLVSLTGIVNDCQQIDIEILLIIDNYILGLLSETSVFFYLILLANMKLEECQPQVQQFC